MQIWHLIIADVAFVFAVLIPVLAYYTKLVKWRSIVELKIEVYDEEIEEVSKAVKEMRSDHKADLLRLEAQREKSSEKIYTVLDEIRKDIRKVSEDIAFIRGGTDGT